jgi:hypothetical protein
MMEVKNPAIKIQMDMSKRYDAWVASSAVIKCIIC